MVEAAIRRRRSKATARLFLALWPDDATRRALAAWRDCWSWPEGAAPVADERLHLTLHFIGAVPRERVEAIAAGLAVPWTPFRLSEGHGQCWRGGLAAWVADETPAGLLEAHARLAKALRGLALPVEQRAFRPHVTVARKVPRKVPRTAAGAAVPSAPPCTLDWLVDGYALVLSEGGYRVLRRYP